MVAIIADTTTSIPQAMADELQIELVPYYVMKGMQTLRDMVDVQPDDFAHYLESAKILPTTSNPSPGDYVNAMLRLAERTREMVALTMTSRGSGAYQSCRAAVEMLCERLPDLRAEVIDTLTVSISHGWATIEAARAAARGLSLREVAERARQVARNSCFFMTADTLRYLYMGGRIGRAQHLVGNMLNIKPIIGMQEGVVVALGTARTRARAYARMVEMIRERVGPMGRIKVAFAHVAALEQLELLKEQVLSSFQCVEVLTVAISPVMAVHTGPGTVGVSFIWE